MNWIFYIAVSSLILNIGFITIAFRYRNLLKFLPRLNPSPKTPANSSKKQVRESGRKEIENEMSNESKEENDTSVLSPIQKHSQKVGEFYNQYNDKFLEVYGDVIQAFRTKDLSKLLDYQIETMDLKKGEKCIDAGCGVCGPATYFAEKAGVQIDAVTISEEQVRRAEEKIKSKGLKKQVKVYLGDYHELPLMFPHETYDVVYFLESFGHSFDHTKAVQSAWAMLKPGGRLYIKDLFLKEAAIEEHEPRILEEAAKINEAYRYNIADLYKILKAIRKQGMIISRLKTIDLKLEEFENLTISNDFQELTGIYQIESWDNYMFPVDFYELVAIKPQYDMKYGSDKYFLQNLYYMQVHGKKQEEL